MHEIPFSHIINFHHHRLMHIHVVTIIDHVERLTYYTMGSSLAIYRKKQQSWGELNPVIIGTLISYEYCCVC